MAKVNKSFRLSEAAVADIKRLVARKYGKSATEAVEKAVHAAMADTKAKGKP